MDGMNFSTDIYGSQGMNLNNFGDPLTFLPAGPAGQSFCSFCEISQYLLDGLAENLVHKLIVPW